MTHSRRSFLQQGSAATFGLFAHWPVERLWNSTPADLVPPHDETLMREMAHLAIDEARRAGASFADLRMCYATAVSVSLAEYSNGQVNTRVWPMVVQHATLGMRAIVDGAWGYAAGSVLDTGAVTELARSAVNGARINRPRRSRRLDLAPAPVVDNGFWEMPIEIDPLTVSLAESRELARSALAQLASESKIESANVGAQWRRLTTIFASTEGSFILQRLRLAQPGGSVTAYAEPGNWRAKGTAEIATMRAGPYGYEAFGAAKLHEGVRDAARKAIEEAELARSAVSVDVGRYDIVFAPRAVTNLLATTLLSAVELPRALGYYANTVGTSFAAPPRDFLGKAPVASELLTLHSDRTQEKGAATTAWDEEGVKPETYTPIKNGVIADYHTDRETAMALSEWYGSRGMPPRAHGVMRGTGELSPSPKLPNITMEPGAHATSVDDLIGGMKRGLYIGGCVGVSDQQVLNSQYTGGRVHRVTNGKLGPRQLDVGFQFITPQFWKRVDALGGPASVERLTVMTSSDEWAYFTQAFPYSTFAVAPMHVRDVNVLNTGRTA